MKILPGLMTIVGRTVQEAQDKLGALQALIADEAAMRLLARLCGDLDIHAFDPDGPLPPLPPSNAAKARQQLLVDLAAKEGLSIRQVARYLGTSLGHQLQVGTPAMIAVATGNVPTRDWGDFHDPRVLVAFAAKTFGVSTAVAAQAAALAAQFAE